MEFFILGPTRLAIDGRDVALGAAKQRGLLALLLYHAGTPVRLETVHEHLWQNGSLDAHRMNIYALASRIRGALRAVGLPQALVRQPSTGAYRLDIDPELVDFHRFRRLLADGRHAAAAGEHERSVALLDAGIDLWRDEPVADLHGSPSDRIRHHMTQTLLAAYKLVADGLLRLGRHDAVLARLEPLVTVNDLDEGLAEPWISALIAAGRYRDAYDFSAEFRRRYRRRMRIEPSIALARPGRPAEERARPHQLPADIADFHGHEDLLAELDRLSDVDRIGPRVVLLDGMPGAGKTTLATHWAHRRLDRFPDGQLYVNADGYGAATPLSAEDAVTRLLHGLGVRADQLPSTMDQKVDRFNQLLAGRRMVVILDNVLNSGQARPLIASADTAMTVITSRNRLTGLTIRPGVRTITVPPLLADDCLDLLTSMVGEARVNRERPAARTLVQRSGGLPLAVRIMAEYIAERPRAGIGELADQLRDNLLDYGSDEEEAAGLRTVFAWSYAALEPDGARLFRLLGAYAGPSVSSAAAAALLDRPEREAERILNRLAGAHLLIHDTANRYRLHDVLRLYALDRARQEDVPASGWAALGRLLDWYVRTAANASAAVAPQFPTVPDLPGQGNQPAEEFPGAGEAMQWCELERPNLVRMVHLAADNGFDRHAWQLPGAVGQLLARSGRQDDVVEIHTIALAAAAADGHVEGRLGTNNNLGAAYFAGHDYASAAEHFRSALVLARTAGRADVESMCLYNLASVHLKSGDAAGALAIFEEVLAGCRSANHVHGLASTLDKIGDALRAQGESVTAEHRYAEALGWWRQLGWPRGQAATLDKLAGLYLARGRPREALDHSQQALAALDEARDEGTHCDVLTTAAAARSRLGWTDEADRDIQAALSMAADLGDSYRTAHALAVRAEILLARSDLDGAREQCELAFSVVRDMVGADAETIRARLNTTLRSSGRWPVDGHHNRPAVA